MDMKIRIGQKERKVLKILLYQGSDAFFKTTICHNLKISIETFAKKSKLLL